MNHYSDYIDAKERNDSLELLQAIKQWAELIITAKYTDTKETAAGFILLMAESRNHNPLTIDVKRRMDQIKELKR